MLLPPVRGGAGSPPRSLGEQPAGQPVQRRRQMKQAVGLARDTVGGGERKFRSARLAVDPKGLLHAMDRPGLGAAIDFDLIRRKTVAVLS